MRLINIIMGRHVMARPILRRRRNDRATRAKFAECISSRNQPNIMPLRPLEVSRATTNRSRRQIHRAGIVNNEMAHRNGCACGHQARKSATLRLQGLADADRRYAVGSNHEAMPGFTALLMLVVARNSVLPFRLRPCIKIMKRCKIC